VQKKSPLGDLGAERIENEEFKNKKQLQITNEKHAPCKGNIIQHRATPYETEHNRITTAHTHDVENGELRIEN
jgi:hypothetical protein